MQSVGGPWGSEARTLQRHVFILHASLLKACANVHSHENRKPKDFQNQERSRASATSDNLHPLTQLITDHMAPLGGANPFCRKHLRRKTLVITPLGK